MTIQIFANNAKTTLAAPITSTQTSITVATGTGTLFPNPTTGQQFKITLVSAASASVYEICNCTSRSGDVLTVVRGQEGTSAQPFILNDIVGHFDTAAIMTDLVQTEQLQSGYYLFAVATGSANALTATLPSNLTSLPNGMSITVISAYANTGAATLNLTLGSTSTGVLPIVTGNNTPLTAGVIPNAGYPITLSYSSTFNAWVITDGQIDLSLYAPKASPTFTGIPQAPTYSPPAPSVPSPTTQLATLGYVYNSLQNYAPIFSPTFTGTPAAPTATYGTSSTQIATTAFVANSGIGNVNQTWHNVLSSRAYNVTYTNSLNVPIVVSCAQGLASVGNDYSWVIVVNGITVWTAQGNPGGGGEGISISATFIVPPGQTYAVYQSSYPSSYLINWVELY